jgi:hypothetical protein
MIAANLRKRRPKPYTTWHLDEVYLKIDGRMVYLWRAVDAEGEVLDVLVQSRFAYRFYAPFFSITYEAVLHFAREVLQFPFRLWSPLYPAPCAFDRRLWYIARPPSMSRGR